MRPNYIYLYDFDVDGWTGLLIGDDREFASGVDVVLVRDALLEPAEAETSPSRLTRFTWKKSSQTVRLLSLAKEDNAA